MMNRVQMTNEKGNRNVKVANAIRKQMMFKLMEVLEAAGLDPHLAANGDIAIPTVVDEATDKTFYFRLAPTLSDKDLTSVPKKSTSRKPVAPVEVPDLFASEEA